MEEAYEGWFRLIHGPSFPRLFSINAFILSHFHMDHYNGLLVAAKKDPPVRDFNHNIRSIYYPGLPEFPENRTFFEALMAVNMIIFGRESGYMAYDFLNAIERLNRHREFSQKGLFKGDNIRLGSTHFEVLWPPRIIESDNFKGKIGKAINDFNRALEEDPDLKKIHDIIREERLFDRIHSEIDQKEKHYPEEIFEFSPYPESEKGEISIVVKAANDSLRSVANYMSLAFHEDNRPLFLGDLEGKMLPDVVAALQQAQRTTFDVIIAPHHGTKWNDSLSNINAVYTLVSNGRQRYKDFKPELKSISETVLSTYVSGDIEYFASSLFSVGSTIE